jgi:hypothetical protein
MSNWFQSNLTSDDGRCDILDGDDFNNKIVATAATAEIAAQIVRGHADAEMSAREYRDAVAAFLPSVGIHAELFTSVGARGPLFGASLYANGIGARGGAGFTVKADSLSDLLKEVTSKWAEFDRRMH